VRKTVLSAAAALGLFLTTSVVAGAEMFGLNTPDEFKVGYQDRNAQTQIVELVEPSDTVENWKRLVTALTYFNISSSMDISAYQESWSKRLKAGCPAVTIAVVAGVVDGRPALRSEVACPLHPKTGRPEILTAVVVQGEADLFVAQVAFGREPDRTDNELVEHVLRSLKVCEEDALAECKAREAIGFVASQ
jgi:hypothetical protein